MKLKAIKLRRKELELEEKALRASPEATEAHVAAGSRREKRTRREEDESTDSDSHHRRRAWEKLGAKVVLTSDSKDEQGDVNKFSLNRLERCHHVWGQKVQPGANCD